MCERRDGIFGRRTRSLYDKVGFPTSFVVYEIRGGCISWRVSQPLRNVPAMTLTDLANGASAARRVQPWTRARRRRSWIGIPARPGAGR